MTSRFLTLPLAALLLMSMTQSGSAQVVTTQTVVSPGTVEGPNIQTINFMGFDINKDGILSMREVGDRLFQYFDRDGNDVIDNIEFGLKTVLTITPVEKETLRLVDIDGDGATDVSTYTYETFHEASGLNRFDKNSDGLSPSEFIQTGFQELDISDNNMIELEEWRKAYIASRAPKSAIQERYRQ